MFIYPFFIINYPFFMPGFLKKLSSLFPQSSTPRIEVAYWRTNSTILVSLDKDWKNSWKMP
ncbi:MAG: hypothetical protein IJW39_00020, partial [Opitutales bacterium]|nr:hypothetical protein [Opitutales bacterium]